jgi:tetrahydromethanopterin S-methyltransferase subunit B
MPRKHLARRFEPRYGVSQSMVDEETKWVAREVEDQLLRSTNELREHLSELQAKVATAEQSLQSKLGTLSDRERLALKGMLARDVFHIAMLYETFLRCSGSVREATGVSDTTPQELNEDGAPRPALVFQQSLFS